MPKSLKKSEFLLPFTRLFTRGLADAYEAMPFQASESFGDEGAPSLAAPSFWSHQSISIMEEAACPTIPTHTRAIEENTVPSWLWRRQSVGSHRARETDLRYIFDRVVGSAAAKAWKLALFSSEKHARAFYDEARFSLMQRHIAFAPEVIASWGLSWAYGIEEKKTARNAPQKKSKLLCLSNSEIDAAIGKTKSVALWKRLFSVSAKELSTVGLRLSDIAQDWHPTSENPARAVIDLLALRHNDGTINIDALRQAARILTVLLDLQDRSDITIGFANLAPLLLALGLTYDSDAARSLAASLAAVVTAECTASSAEMAALRGASETFSHNRDAVMRSLRNHRRAVYGDANDYEKLSVLPIPLSLKSCPDLALAAEAQRRWDEATVLAQNFGLRSIHATDLTPSKSLAILMASATQGLEPLPRLTVLKNEDDFYHVALHPAMFEALTRLEYPEPIIKNAVHHIVGTHSLRHAPGINHVSLRARGLTEAALEKIEAYLPCVDKITTAITPWVLGFDFCKKVLGLSVHLLRSARFDLLHHLGFDDKEIELANLYCYGHGSARNARILQLRHRPLFAVGSEVTTEAKVRMAASVQSFISGATGVVASLPASQSILQGAETTLTAWKSGLKSVTLIFDPALEARPVLEKTRDGRRIRALSEAPSKIFARSSARSKSRKSLVHLNSKKGRAAHKAH